MILDISVHCHANEPMTQTAVIWTYFTIHDGNRSKAACKLHSVKIPRGGTIASSYYTSNLIKYLVVFNYQ